jgi:hypothetical protein
MKLTPQQHAQFDRDAYLFFPGLFTLEETQTLNDAVPELYERREDYNVREKGKDAVRTNFAVHMYSEPFAKLGRHPRMIEPVEELLGENLYMHQFIIVTRLQKGSTMRRRRLLALLGATGAVPMLARAADMEISGSGASFPAKIYQQWAEQYATTPVSRSTSGPTVRRLASNNSRPARLTSALPTCRCAAPSSVNMGCSNSPRSSGAWCRS